MAPAPLLAWRYLAATAVLLLACLVLPVRALPGSFTVRTVTQQVGLGLLAHVVFLGGVFGAASLGLDAGISALVCALQPMVVAGASAVWFKDRLRPRQWVGLVVGIAGVALSVGALQGSASTGAWLVGGSVLGLSLSALLERAWQPTMPLLWSLSLQTAVGCLAFTAWSLVTTGLPISSSPTFFLAICWLVGLSGLGGYASYTGCLRRLGATATSTLLYLTPAVTALWAWIMFHQELARSQMLGIAVVLLGVALTLWHRQSTPAHRTPAPS